MSSIKENCDRSPINFTISAPGKLILFGEHSVVYGKSALAACINKRTYLKFSENDKDEKEILVIKMKDIDFNFSFKYKDILNIIHIDIPCYDQKAQDRPVTPDDINHDEFVSIIKGYLQKFSGAEFVKLKPQELPMMVVLYILHGLFYKENLNHQTLSILPFTIDISSELIIGAGSGSSASFCVSVAAALYHYKNILKYGQTHANCVSFTKEGLNVISKWALVGEKIMHGKPSGVDSTVTTFGYYIEVRSEIDAKTNKPKRVFRNLPRPPRMIALIISSGVFRNTSLMISHVAKLKSKHPIIVDHILDSMDKISLEAINVVNEMGSKEGDNSLCPEFSHLETLIDMNQGLLYSLGVSHQCLQDICLICSRYELHAKLTGAGGGGYAFALVPPNYNSVKLNECIYELEKNGYKVERTELGLEGVRLEHN